jgi:hypothetical protein
MELMNASIFSISTCHHIHMEKFAVAHSKMVALAIAYRNL